MRFLFYFFVIVFLSVFGFLWHIYSDIKVEADRLVNYTPKLVTQILDKHGDVIANIFDEEYRFLIKYEDIPPKVVESLVAIEDTVFFEHIGVNFEAVMRAVLKDIKARKFVEGASTITQQLVKNTLLSHDKKIMRKIKEMLLAIKIEYELTKEQILERYLNEVYFGHGYYGIKAASLGYFNKNLANLSLKEIAILVGIPKSPNAYNPTRHYEVSLGRANRVISRLYSLGWITKEEYDSALEEKPEVYDNTLSKQQAPYVTDEVLRQLSHIKDLKSGGYKIHTSIDLKLQKIARKSLQDGHAQVKARHEDENLSDLNGAIIVLDNQNANILALVGGVDYDTSSFNRATQSRRQPGSSFKPFIYQYAIDSGYSSLSKIPDISRTFEERDDTSEDGVKYWKPKNYEKDTKGLIPLEYALVHSRNLATINLVRELGLDNLHQFMNDIGFKNVPLDLSIALGSFGISLLDLSSFYTLFSNYGTILKPILITKLEDRFGNSQSFSTSKKRITSKKQAFLMIDLLKKVVSFGTGRRAWVKGIELAGKTGTSNNFVDALFCGFSPQIQTLVWFGRDSNKPIGKKESGGRVSGPVFKNFYEEYLRTYPQTKRRFTVPKGVKKTYINNKKVYFTDKSKLDTSNEENILIEDDFIF